MASKKGRKLNNWERNSYTIALRVLCALMYDRLHRRHDADTQRQLVRWFWRLVPFAQVYFEHPLTHGAIWGRAFTPTARTKRAKEGLSVNSNSAPFVRVCNRLLDRDRPLTRQEFEDAVDASLPELCEGCLIYYADPPSKLCPGCKAYRDHQM